MTCIRAFDENSVWHRKEVTMVAKRGMKNKFKGQKTKQNKMGNEN